MKTVQAVSTLLATPERRPMFTRNWNVSQQFARWLIARNVPPNAISLAFCSSGVFGLAADDGGEEGLLGHPRDDNGPGLTPN